MHFAFLYGCKEKQKGYMEGLNAMPQLLLSLVIASVLGKGVGKIRVTCPSCKHKFEART